MLWAVTQEPTEACFGAVRVFMEKRKAAATLGDGLAARRAICALLATQHASLGVAPLQASAASALAALGRKMWELELEEGVGPLGELWLCGIWYSEGCLALLPRAFQNARDARAAARGYCPPATLGLNPASESMQALQEEGLDPAHLKLQVVLRVCSGAARRGALRRGPRGRVSVPPSPL